MLKDICRKEFRLKTTQLFVRLVYIWIFVQYLCLFPYRNSLFSPSAYIPHYDSANIFMELSDLINHPKLAAFQIGWYYGLIVLSALGIWGKFARLNWLLTFFVLSNVERKLWVMMDGGNNLLSIIFVFFLFANTSGSSLRMDRWRLLKEPLVVAHNIATLLAPIQVAIVYLTSGLLKMSGDLWQKGMALYYILQTKTYSAPIGQELTLKFPHFFVAAAYLTIAFQICFPFLVWDKRTRAWILTMGCLFHLGIVFGMGLSFFGAIMMISYALFIEQRTAEYWLNLPGKIYSRLKRMSLALPVRSRHVLSRSGIE